MANTASWPCIRTRNSFTGRDPRYRVRVSDKSPVTGSRTVLSSTPFCSPIFRYRKPIEPLSPSSSCFSVPPISTIHKDSGWAGRACMLRGCKQSEGSREMILTVLSTSPTARKRDRCSPGGTLARLMHTTSADISFRSVYSFSCPEGSISK